MSSSSDPGGTQHAGGTIPSLDGIRMLSVTLVFLSHAGLGKAIPGGLGVTIFFVLSGYLITTLMRTEHAGRGWVDFPAFYLRRFLRLMPPLVVVTGLAVAANLVLGVGRPVSWTGLSAVLFYFSNYYRIFAGDGLDEPPGLAVTWSLAVEEHYYLLFPLLALPLMRLRRRRSALLLGGLCALILLWRAFLQLNGASEGRLEMGTDTRVDAILVGCLMAMVKNPWVDPVPGPSPGRDLVLGLACLSLLGATLLWRNPFFRITLRYTVQSLSIAVLMYLAVARAQKWPFRWLNARPVAYLGTISYSIYLVHALVLLTVTTCAPSLAVPAVAAASALITLLIAALIGEWVEQPCNRLRRHLHETLLIKPGKGTVAAVGPS
jgi:peptidoglycan/LPS O-acetylase OafA/YrhL